MSRERDAMAADSGARPRSAVTTLFFINGTTFGSWVSRIPDVTSRLDLTEGQLGLALLGVAAGAVAVMPTVAPAVRRFGSRRVCVAAALTFCATLPLLGLARSLPALTIALVLFGAGNGSLDVSMNDNGGRLERGLPRPIMGSLHAAFSCGAAAGALTGGVLASLGVPPAVHFAVIAAVLAAAAGWAGRHLIDLPDPPPTGVQRPRPRTHVSPALLILLLIGLCAAFAEGAISDWSALYLVNTLGTSTGLGAIGFVAFSALMVIGRLSQDRLVRRVGESTIRRSGATVAAAGMTMALLTDEPALAIPALGMVGIGLAAIFPITMSAASRLPGIAPANAVAAVSTIAYTALLAGPPLIGLLAETTTLGTALWAVTGALLLIATPPFPTLNNPGDQQRGRKQPSTRATTTPTHGAVPDNL